MRGFAAVSVLIAHFLGTFPTLQEDRPRLVSEGFAAPNAWLYLTPLRLAVAGSSAVVLFFVLSGLVLALSLSGTRSREPYAAYMAKRMARIWLPFVVAICFSAVLMAVIGSNHIVGTSKWFDYTWSEPLSPSLLKRTLAMTGRSITLDNPMWSLVHEMRASIIFPILLVATRRAWWASLASAGLACVLAAKVLAHRPEWVTPASTLQTVLYLPAFVLGICIALHSHGLRDWVARQPRPIVAGLWVLSLAALAYGPPPTGGVVFSVRQVAHLLVVTGSAGLLLVLCIVEGQASRFLTTRVPLFLGRISYSLYLTHVVVLVTVVRLLDGYLPLEPRVALAVPTAFLVAFLFNHYVEKPSAALGVRAASLIQAWHSRTFPTAAE